MNAKALILVAVSGLIAFSAVSANAAQRAAAPARPQAGYAFPLFEGRNAANAPSLLAAAARNTDAAIRIETHYDIHSR
ncbi:hypothetical protein ACO2RV_17755 [Ancylobacter sp. VNQ12]|uniref:hypothetical protein n=1 Tax=Ancylobacter sp. VNQ12 TaxID=3400920 RepID=UPI003C04EAFB